MSSAPHVLWDGDKDLGRAIVANLAWGTAVKRSIISAEPTGGHAPLPTLPPTPGQGWPHTPALFVVVVVARPPSLRCDQTRCQPSSLYPVALDPHQSPEDAHLVGQDVDAVTLIEHPWTQTLSVLLEPLDFVSYDGA